jgi:Fe-S-cluster containining protein
MAEPSVTRAVPLGSDQDARYTRDPLNAVLVHALLAEYEAATAIVAAGRTVATVRELMEQAFAATRTYTEALLQRTPADAQPACRAGCAWCCAIPVSVLPPEALLIALHLRARRTADALAAIVERLCQRVEARHGWTLQQRRTHKSLCVFLQVDGRCGIYEGRPLACRGYTSSSATACQEDRDPLPVHEGVLSATSGVSYGLLDATEALGLDATRYELASAVLRALEVPDATARWLRGERVFAGCDQLSGHCQLNG